MFPPRTEGREEKYFSRFHVFTFSSGFIFFLLCEKGGSFLRSD